MNNGTRLLLYSWQNNNDQKWIIEAVGNTVILRLARDTSKVLNRHSVNNNAIVWHYDGSAATKLDSLIDTETTNGNTRIKLTGRGLYLTKNAGDNYLSWTGKIESNRQYFKLVNETDYGGGSGTSLDGAAAWISSVIGTTAQDVDGSAGVQCVDLAKKYMRDYFGLNPGALGDGKDFYANAAATYPNTFQRINATNGTMALQKGDIVSMRGTNGVYGHVA